MATYYHQVDGEATSFLAGKTLAEKNFTNLHFVLSRFKQVVNGNPWPSAITCPISSLHIRAAEMAFLLISHPKTLRSRLYQRKLLKKSYLLHNLFL